MKRASLVSWKGVRFWPPLTARVCLRQFFQSLFVAIRNPAPTARGGSDRVGGRTRQVDQEDNGLRGGNRGARLSLPFQRNTQGRVVKNMDKERVKGVAQQKKGAVKEGLGKVVGDEKLKAEGKMDKAEGKVRNAVGGAKDAIRDLNKPKH